MVQHACSVSNSNYFQRKRDRQEGRIGALFFYFKLLWDFNDVESGNTEEVLLQ